MSDYTLSGGIDFRKGVKDSFSDYLDKLRNDKWGLGFERPPFEKALSEAIAKAIIERYFGNYTGGAVLNERIAKQLLDVSKEKWEKWGQSHGLHPLCETRN